MQIKIALVGLGKISRDQHIPAIADDPDFELAATVCPDLLSDGVSSFRDLESLIEVAAADAVAINTPPQPRYELARTALLAGMHVLLEKPPTLTPSQLYELAQIAEAKGRSLYTAWHSQHAPGVETARIWLAGRRLRSVEMRWREDVRQWHPGQKWIWQTGGFGVFDPAINGFSILTRILPEPLLLTNARLAFPGNCQAPASGWVEGVVGHEASFSANLDFLHEGRAEWSIDISTDDGILSLTAGGAELNIAGEPQQLGTISEYTSIYQAFGRLVRAGECMVDAAPLQLVTEAFLLAERINAPDFVE